jgi:hypothetical protein
MARVESIFIQKTVGKGGYYFTGIYYRAGGPGYVGATCVHVCVSHPISDLKMTDQGSYCMDGHSKVCDG